MQRHKNWTRRLALAMTMGALMLAGPAIAQNASGRPITIVVGFAPGAGTDMLARGIAEKLQARLGQPVVVENKPGGSGVLAVNAVAGAPADGNTLLLTPNTLVITPHVQKAASRVNVLTDLVPVVQVTRSTLMLVASPALGVKDAKALTAAARGKPGMSYGTAGNGTPQHIAGELYKRSAGIDINHVPYRGTGPALTDVMGGHLPMAISSLGAALPHIQAGRITPIAIVEKTRSPLLPEVPTMTEQGINGVELSGWFGIVAPRGTPQAQVDRLNREINAVLADPALQQTFRAQGEVPTGGTQAAFVALMQQEFAFYERIVKAFGIQGE